jgi:uncharacterized protein YjdB
MSRAGASHRLSRSALLLLLAAAGCSDSSGPAPVADVVVTPQTAEVETGSTLQLSASVRDGEGNPLTDRPVTWSSSSDAVGTVSPTGLLTAVSTGTVTVTATSEGQTGQAVIGVIVPPVATVSLNPPTSTVLVQQTVQIHATLFDARGRVALGRAVAWRSENPGVATVSETGLVRGVAAGTATITATAEGK